MSFRTISTRLAIIAILIVSLIACNNDFNEIGSSMVDHNNFDALLYNKAALSAQSEKIEKVKSNNLSSYALGVFQDPVYGRTTANVLTQLALSRENPNFGNEPELDSVMLVVPFFSSATEKDQFNTKYKLDSVFGNGSIKLSVFRSGYYLRDFDPTDNYNPQTYYSNDIEKFENNLESEPLYENYNWRPSGKEVVLTTPKRNPEGDEQDTTKMSPQLRIKLPKAYFEEAIINKEGSSELQTNPNFADYFRGIYFKAEQMQNEGVFSLLNFRSDDAGIFLYYKNERPDGEDEEGNPTYTYSNFKLNFARQTVNVFETEYQDLPAGDNLYLKGGQGSLAVIDLFTDENQLDSLKNTGWLINEANLKFYINKDEIIGNQKGPERLFIYDIKNKRVLKDYSLSGGVKENDVLNSRTIHLGRIESDSHGDYYKIRITNYINDIINNDSTNTRLGLVVSQNVNIDNMAKAETSDETISAVPQSTVLARNGTVLYGPEAPQGKALRLEIYYTESK